MPKKINDTGRAIFVNGRDIPEGAFYDAPEEVTDEFEVEDPTSLTIPAEKDITILQIKGTLEEWKVEYTAEQSKDKATFYAFFVEEAIKHGYVRAD